MRVRLNLYKSMILTILTFACSCFSLSRTSLKTVENVQERVLKWMCRDYNSSYKDLLLKCNLLTVPMLFQLSSLLFLSKYYHELRFKGVDLNITLSLSKKARMMFNIKTVRTEKARAEFQDMPPCKQASGKSEFLRTLGIKTQNPRLHVATLSPALHR